MKIGILTLPGNNYGGMLQAYALKTKLEDLGENVNHINYKMTKKKNIKDEIKKVVYYSRNKKFRKFRIKYLNLINEDNDFKKFNEENFDAYIVGSDQVWNQRIPWEQRKHFFLDFVDKKRKIAYAASIGSDIIEENEREKISCLLDRLDSISIREETGVKMYQKLTMKKIANVLDPTLLLSRNEWDKIASTRIKEEDYVFSYTLGANKNILNKMDELSYKLGNGIVEISYKKNFKNERKSINNAGPCEFITLIKNANYVLTNSFHGMVFSIIYGKPFLVFTRGNMNSRIYDLLQILDLKDRIIDLEKNDEMEIEKKLDKKIDYDNVYKILNNEQRKSLDFLKESLEIKE